MNMFALPTPAECFRWVLLKKVLTQIYTNSLQSEFTATKAEEPEVLAKLTRVSVSAITSEWKSIQKLLMCQNITGSEVFVLSDIVWHTLALERDDARRIQKKSSICLGKTCQMTEPVMLTMSGRNHSWSHAERSLELLRRYVCLKYEQVVLKVQAGTESTSKNPRRVLHWPTSQQTQLVKANK